ncbi:hypothetical protein MLD63_08460 [Paracoccus sp. TK19116]|uniref:Primosomal protein N' 3' DNA-binding domain-containing protein n=1 Tax=Paracoccus albicereus TaxID=2922394 RepID=A0ABT1MQ60_9RHOB|nr:hypothetical protein [Paracoccus albicereus]
MKIVKKRMRVARLEKKRIGREPWWKQAPTITGQEEKWRVAVPQRVGDRECGFIADLDIQDGRIRKFDIVDRIIDIPERTDDVVSEILDLTDKFVGDHELVFY